MKKGMILTGIIAAIFILSGQAFAHFGMVIPSDSMVMQGENKDVTVTLSFSHPFEGHGMELVTPVAFGVMSNGNKQNLLGSLKKATVMGHTAWESGYSIKRPGVYMFYMEPKPYWEPAEIGLKTEIVPLSKPFGLYTGNVFQGIVKLDGKPVPSAEVEVEYYNKDGKAHAPTDYMVTQTIKADNNGIFTCAAPKAGWWGFAALNTADEKLKHEGEEKDVEIGAVIWVEFHDWKEK